MPQPLQLVSCPFGVQLEVIQLVDEHQVRRHADVVEHHVEHHRHAAPVKRRDQLLQLAHARRLLRLERIAALRREEIIRHVAPVIFLRA